MKASDPINIAIACGGTGGHLFPGLAVAEQLRERGCAVTLMISPKEVDQQAVANVSGMEIVTLPAVGLTRRAVIAFLRGFVRSYRASQEVFRAQPPAAVLAMGGFTSAPPILAGRRLGARTFLHESNSIPGRANRWLSRVVNRAFVGFPSAGTRLRKCGVTVTGTPVRPEFQLRGVAACRSALGLDPARPVLLVMGGSQGAGGINELVMRSLPVFAKLAPGWQWFHLTGPSHTERVKQAYAANGLKAMVYPFSANMALALGAATAAISRAGASSLAELAAMRVPAVLIPYPTATYNHQFHNAHALVLAGAARLLEQETATSEALAGALADFMENTEVRERTQEALAEWHTPNAAREIAEAMLKAAGVEAREVSGPGGLKIWGGAEALAEVSHLRILTARSPSPQPSPQGEGEASPANFACASADYKSTLPSRGAA
jgi:UDP-N-acetylglucosamine--N-acetylmuramyl-(pentapeptide) pyrophosphoryl-undecaprenol N-acetylglucosamine transferase